ncbi:ATP-binding Cassette (ABC) Superfamily [Achlya hypogyna]|uniref:ATP-binding Cassette (ABC) Superfamily n=1 Tax=Achlya hypogyna TaxID=1202772 RepID=A0A1V9YFF0_ACHHY|nr:ATP-binding Cassette (ABC) Superfamily [Achlya hypogyna]
MALEFRDIVYFDPFEKVWRGSVDADDTIVTAFGPVTCTKLLPHDGTVLCSHPCGALAYIKGDWITRDREGQYCVMSRTAPAPPQGRAAEYYEIDDEDPAPRKPTIVDLRGCYVLAHDMRLLAEPLATNYFVLTLNLSGNGLGDDSIRLLSGALATNAALRTLVLSYNDVRAAGAVALAESLGANGTVTHVDLSHNHIGCNGLVAWLSLKTNSTLETLLMSHNPAIDDGGGVDLLRALATEPRSLHEETRLKLLLKSATYVASLLDAPANTSVLTLCLSDIGLSLASAERLRHVLTATAVLRTLDVSMNSFSAACHAQLALGLAANASLTHLNYGANPLDDAAGEAMAQALTGHPTLITALFPVCFGGATAGAHLAALVATTTRLTHLDVSGRHIEAPGIVALCKAIGSNHSLRILELTSTGLKSDTVVQVLARALEANQTLEQLHLGYNNITLRGCKLLREAVATNARCQLTAETLFLEGNSGTKARGSGVLISGGSLSPTKPPSHPNDTIT